jgi:hypothetical protein
LCFAAIPPEIGGAALAEQAGCALLGQLPLDPNMRVCADDGVSYLEKHAGSDAANMLEEIAIRLQSKL